MHDFFDSSSDFGNTRYFVGGFLILFVGNVAGFAERSRCMFEGEGKFIAQHGNMAIYALWGLILVDSVA